ncbi:NPCBM/NEW2 domain-containing protein [bacterium]|nr:NPCBM/NEW2 domain-containing protein [bacterium]
MRTFFSKAIATLSAILLIVGVGWTQNLIQNPGFEEGTGELPDHWATFIQTGSPEFSWVSDEFHAGAKSICITHTDSAMSSFYQKVAVQPNYKYKVSGYIKTAGVEIGENWWEGGAQLRIDGDVQGNWWDNMTSRVYGDSDWTYVELEITTTEDADTIEVHCKLGEGLKITGTAWFDDISLEEVEAVGQWFVNGDFETEDPESPGFPLGWELESNTDELGTVNLDDAVYHGGSKSCRLYRPANHGGEIMIKQTAGPEPYGLVDGAVYKFSGWIKTQGVTGGRGACFITAWDNHTIGNVSLHGDKDWTYVEELITYKKTDWGAWRCYLGVDSTANEGIAWFDDIQLEFIGVPPEPPTDFTAEYDGTQITLNWGAATQGSNDIAYYLIRKIIQNDTTGNIKKNPGFEEPNEDFTFPDDWGYWSYGEQANYAWDDQNPHSGSFCVSMDHATGGWGMIYRRVYPPEGSTGCDVLIRGFIKTEDVSGGSGVHVDLGYTSAEVTSEGLFGTNDYIVVENYHSLPPSGNYVSCLFGLSGEQVTGKAWFDDVTVTPFDSIAAVDPGGELTYVDTDVVPDTTYYYSVRTVDTRGLYSESVIKKIDLRLPKSVTLASPRDGIRVLEAKLTWEQVMGVDGYYVKVQKSGVKVWETDNVTETSVIVPAEQLEEDSTYTWTVQYIKNGVYSDVSEEWSFIFTKWPTVYDYISDMTETYWQNGWGDGNKDLSNDGNPILIAGVQYDKGLGMHAPSEVHYALDGNYDYFMAFIGHDDEANGGNGVIFKVVVDDDTVYESRSMRWGEPAELIKIQVTGADTLRLLMDHNGDMGWDHADWADAILYNLESQGVESQTAILPTTTELIGNYPNPFNPATTIVFQLHKPAKVELEVFNILGQKVTTLVNKRYDAGVYRIKWDATSYDGGRLTSGVYLYRLKAGKITKVRKLLLLR